LDIFIFILFSMGKYLVIQMRRTCYLTFALLVFLIIASLSDSKVVDRVNRVIGRGLEYDEIESIKNEIIVSKRQSTETSIARLPTILANNQAIQSSEACEIQKNIEKRSPFVKVITNKLTGTNSTVLSFYGLMVAGAVARSVSATAVHPLNVIKTMLQTRHGQWPAMRWSVLSRGAGSQLLMSIPHGAFSFVVTEVI
jgi:hypothetical protein